MTKEEIIKAWEKKKRWKLIEGGLCVDPDDVVRPKRHYDEALNNHLLSTTVEAVKMAAFYSNEDWWAKFGDDTEAIININDAGDTARDFLSKIRSDK